MMSLRSNRSLAASGLTAVALLLAACQAGANRAPGSVFGGRDKDSTIGRMTLHDGTSAAVKMGDLALQGTAAQIWVSACPNDLSLSGFYSGFARIPGMLAESTSSVGADAVRLEKLSATTASRVAGNCGNVKRKLIENAQFNIFLNPKRN